MQQAAIMRVLLRLSLQPLATMSYRLALAAPHVVTVLWRQGWGERDLVPFDIEQFWPRILFGLAYLHLFVGKQVSDLCVGVVHVAGDNGVYRTDDDTGGFDADFYSVSAVVAFGGRVGVGIDIECVVRASLGACLATDATVIVEIDNPIRSGIERGDRADLHAGCVGAVVTAVNGEQTAGVRIDTFLNV